MYLQSSPINWWKPTTFLHKWGGFCKLVRYCNTFFSRQKDWEKNCSRSARAQFELTLKAPERPVQTDIESCHPQFSSRQSSANPDLPVWCLQSLRTREADTRTIHIDKASPLQKFARLHRWHPRQHHWQILRRQRFKKVKACSDLQWKFSRNLGRIIGTVTVKNDQGNLKTVKMNKSLI